MAAKPWEGMAIPPQEIIKAELCDFLCQNENFAQIV